MAIVWARFHKQRVPNSELSTNFLIVAPNVIVYQRLERYEEATTWATPRHFIEMAAGWWSMATRLDGIAVADRAAILTRAAGAIERELGPGPLQIAGATNVLLAIA